MTQNNDDFQTISNDVEGFYSGEGAITFLPMHVHLCDNGADKRKPSTLIVGKLVASDMLVLDNEAVELEAGAMVGVWYSPGMRPVLQCGGVVTRITRTPDKDKKLDGKPSPMKAYDVGTKGGKRGTMLTVLEDYRKQSKGSPTPFDEPSRKTEAAAQIGDDETPF